MTKIHKYAIHKFNTQNTEIYNMIPQVADIINKIHDDTGSLGFPVSAKYYLIHRLVNRIAILMWATLTLSLEPKINPLKSSNLKSKLVARTGLRIRVRLCQQKQQ